MRRVQIGDILALAGMVAGLPDGLSVAIRICGEAHAAHAYMKRFGRLHPRWGNGSLMSRACADGGRMQADWTAEGVAALGLACEALAVWRKERLDCREAPRYVTLSLSNEECAHGRSPAQTEQYRSGLGPCVSRGA